MEPIITAFIGDDGEVEFIDGGASTAQTPTENKLDEIIELLGKMDEIITLLKRMDDKYIRNIIR